MDWLRKLLESNPASIILVPSLLSAFTFFGHLVSALSDGVIDNQEFHQLMSTANGVEMVILFLIIYILNRNS